MRSLLAVWLIALLSMIPLDVSAARQPVSLKQEETPITLEEYWARVGETREVVHELGTEPAPEIRRQLDALASQWERVRDVQLPDGSVIQVDSDFLVTELRTDPPQLERLGKLLDALLQAHEEYPQKLFSPADVIPLTEILARPEFQWQEAQTLQMPDWWVRFLDWLDRLTNRFRNATFRFGRVPLIVAAVVIFLLSLFFISRGLSRSLVREAQLLTEEAANDEMLTSRGALKRAETLSTQGDYRNAVRYLYLSSLLVLDEQGLMRYDRSRTNREYLRSVSARPELADPLRKVIDVFDRVWYGFEAVDENTYNSYVQHVEELREKKE
jgi:hypothetical protein